MFYQRSLLAEGPPGFDPGAPLPRTELDGRSWVEFAPDWMAGADELFDLLLDRLAWSQRENIRMYDSVVDEPRLTHWWSARGGEPDPLPILAEVRSVLSARYDVAFDSIGFNLYRHGRDSVAWHGDRHRDIVVDPVVAILSVGAARPFRLRPVGGGRSRSWRLGHGALLVMGGACQHDWEHCVPKLRAAGPRISITFRHGATR